jgi:pentose-5-phosphate-3-epimerase
MGLALLPETNPEHVLDELEYLDHVLIFSGNLGHFGGAADLTLLRKVDKLKRYKPSLEIGWDGGANLDTVKQLSDGGVDVINVGGFIQLSENPKSAFEQLTSLIQS